MRRLLQDAYLNSSIDFDGNDLKNVDQMLPVPSNLVDADDSRLGDQRPVPNASVTNEKVSYVAAIEQSKLSLDGDIPPEWIYDGTSTPFDPAHMAARGDKAELLSRKNVANGYVGLDSNKRVTVGQMPSTGPGAGTVNTVGLSMPQEVFSVSAILVSAGSLTAGWKQAPDNSWLGVSGQVGLGPGNVPVFQTKLVPDDMVPNLSATKFTTGVFDLDRLPVVKGLGTGHAPGIVPDPGAVGDTTDYLARDATFKSVTRTISYQPTLPKVQITLQYYQNGFASIILYCPQKGARIFYHIENPLLIPVLTPYTETDNPKLIITNPKYVVYAYAAKAGYNNSDVNSFAVPPLPNE